MISKYINFESQHIYCTKDYSIFKFSERNRDLENLPKMIKNIKENNLLIDNPILVSKDMIVLDGQHRLKAAETLNLPIYYKITNMKESDIPYLQVSKPWQIRNYFKFYSQHENFKFVSELSEKYNIKPQNIVYMIAKKNYKELLGDNIRKGNLEFMYTKEEIETKFAQLYEIIIEIKKIRKELLIDRELKTIWSLLFIENFKIKDFLNKIQNYPDLVIKAFKFRSVRDILNELVYLYNYKRSGKNKIQLN